MEHYSIPVVDIFSNQDIKMYENKGHLISNVMDDRNLSRAIFLDDSTYHLDTVHDMRVDCYFADWGYGKNTNYPVFNSF